MNFVHACETPTGDMDWSCLYGKNNEASRTCCGDYVKLIWSQGCDERKKLRIVRNYEMAVGFKKD